VDIRARDPAMTSRRSRRRGMPTAEPFAVVWVFSGDQKFFLI
jgi:hypothetical protein